MGWILLFGAWLLDLSRLYEWSMGNIIMNCVSGNLFRTDLGVWHIFPL